MKKKVTVSIIALLTVVCLLIIGTGCNIVNVESASLGGTQYKIWVGRNLNSPKADIYVTLYNNNDKQIGSKTLKNGVDNISFIVNTKDNGGAGVYTVKANCPSTGDTYSHLFSVN